MAKKNLSALNTTRHAGQRTEEPISSRLSELLINDAEGSFHTLPFVYSAEALSKFISLDPDQKNTIKQVCLIHSLRIPLFYLKLMENNNPFCPIRRQAIPSTEELQDEGDDDPLKENDISITPVLMKRYPGRAVFLISSECAMYCRFCNRKRIVGKGWDPGEFFEESFKYLSSDTTIREIILSGGDPFMIQPGLLDDILSRLRTMQHIRTIRISTRMPIVDPVRMTEEHFRILKKHEPLWIVFHINHPLEVTLEFLENVKKFRNAGSAMISQTVLLRNINDCENILLKLFEALVAAGVKPYYLFQLDEVRGAQHFKVRLERGIRIMKALRAKASGLAMPQYAVDITGGLGKVPVDYVYLKGRKGKKVYMENLSGVTGAYTDDGQKSRCNKCGLCK
ncbi:MAG: KamA family radical SAM protein [Syntrophorhabdaceae bacterium]|nr:KamA family radical SAM protein [Syntrophorhabdaceae bacterium]